MSKIFALIFCLFWCGCGVSETTGNEVLKYGEKISYAGGKEIKFPNFSLKFIGRREEKFPKAESSPRRMVFYDFEIANGETKQKVSWSSGTGDIAPMFFEVGGAKYVLELSQSDILKSLGEGNLVVWKKSDYEEKLKKN